MKQASHGLSPRARTAVLVAGSLALSLSATAWADLATRPATHLRGTKSLWSALIGLAYVGPLAYALVGVHTKHLSPVPED
jgi:hypothetical protein